ncbi:ABC transporter permease [Nocardioides sp. Kera G14]|uniref:ABC transporter permease n=1 Tax=Nocardioides sp. Kera G14 TaxID=2884264 RepID=UPI001D10B65C|nr:ABC transporter permease [Nocardioides sp. Kera G14]UDY23036.1 ABC transporter permease [Nocardioides sp. Kera G14]
MKRSTYLWFAARRIGQALVVIVLAYLATFLVLSILPGDPISTVLNNPDNGYTPDQVAKIISYFKLDDPTWVQLARAISRFVSGDLGISYGTQQPVTHMITQVAKSTLALAGVGLVVALIVAFAVGYGSYALPKWAGRDALRSFPSLFLAVPNYVVGLLVLLFFSFNLNLFSVVEPESVTATLFAGLTLGIPVSAQLAEVVIATLNHEADQEYASVARSRGLTKGRLFLAHLLKPSSIPVVTVIALIVGELLGGAIITEQLFGRDGMGTLLIRSVSTQDTPVVQAMVVLAAAIFVVVNLAADLAYPFLDPRVRGTARREPSLPAPGRVPRDGGGFVPSALTPSAEA